MSKFKVGDKVRVVKGHNKGEVGIVTNPYWQIAANDWPFVLYDQEDGTRGSADESNMELIEDPTCEYEYAVQRTSIVRPDQMFIVGNYWSDLEDRQDALDGLKALNRTSVKYWLVKRRKAGKVEIV